jgi:predicted dehydrogenase
MHCRVNAGYIPLDHWVHGEEGGGRIIGEICHFIDLFTFFVECKVRGVYTSALIPKTKSLSSSDNRVIVLNYEDGSMATLEYFAVGSKAFPKEYMEIHFDEKTIVIDDFKSMKGFGVQVKQMKGRVSEKGHREELQALSDVLQGRTSKWPIELWDLIQTTALTFMVSDQNQRDWD